MLLRTGGIIGQTKDAQNPGYRCPYFINILIVPAAKQVALEYHHTACEGGKTLPWREQKRISHKQKLLNIWVFHKRILVNLKTIKSFSKTLSKVIQAKISFHTHPSSTDTAHVILADDLAPIWGE